VTYSSVFPLRTFGNVTTARGTCFPSRIWCHARACNGNDRGNMLGGCMRACVVVPFESSAKNCIQQLCGTQL
jgi:hypothetical protein